MFKKDYSKRQVIVRVILWMVILVGFLVLVNFTLFRERKNLEETIDKGIIEKWCLIESFLDDQNVAMVVIDGSPYQMVVDSEYVEKHGIGEVILCYEYDNKYYGTSDLAVENNMHESSFIGYYLLLILGSVVCLVRIVILVVNYFRGKKSQVVVNS